MKPKVIINFRSVFFVLLYGAFLAFSGFFLVNEPCFEAAISFAVLLALTVGWIIVFPHYIQITEQNVTICYAFGQKLFARWENINEIQTHTYRMFTDYRFIPMRGKRNRFQNGSFPKSRRLRKLIERYWNGIIY